MLVSLHNFSTLLDARQVQKGKDYFSQGAVAFATELKEGQWKAEVTGTDDYHITLKFEGDTITSTRCDCPHDDPFCKHVVAVLFFIQQQKRSTAPGAKTSKAKKGPAKAPSFETVLEKVKEKELKAFLKTYAARNKEFRNLFLLRFEVAGKEAGLQTFTTLIRKTAALYTRGGYIDWDDAKKALQPAVDILDEAENHFDEEAFRVAFDAACAVVLEVPPLLEYMDDSNGVAGDCIHRAFALLEQLAESSAVPYSLKDAVFAFAEKEFKKDHYSDFGFDDTLLQLLVTAAYDSDKQETIFSSIDTKLKKTGEPYSRKWLLDAKRALLQKAGREAEAAAVLQANAAIPEYREQLIQEQIEQKRYNEAKRLAAEGLRAEAARQAWLQNSERWETWLLKIARLQNDVPEIRRLSQRLYFGRSFHQAYYELYRSTFSKAEWPEACESWIQRFFVLERLNAQQLFALAQVYSTEKMYDRLLGLLQKNPHYELAQFCEPHLKQQYEWELLEVYRQSLIRFAADSNNRAQYMELCKRLKHVQQTTAGKELAKELVNQFLVQYKQRRAMREELNKLIV